MPLVKTNVTDWSPHSQNEILSIANERYAARVHLQMGQQASAVRPIFVRPNRTYTLYFGLNSMIMMSTAGESKAVEIQTRDTYSNPIIAGGELKSFSVNTCECHRPAQCYLDHEPYEFELRSEF